MSVRSSIHCPSCHGPLVPIELRCDACDISVVGRFIPNEFTTLGEDDLHFLRIFVRCEGRIRDMESAMGVSYPTIKARMAKLKDALDTAATAPADEAPVPATENPTAILNDLKSGRLTYDQALDQIKKLKEKTP